MYQPHTFLNKSSSKLVLFKDVDFAPPNVVFEEPLFDHCLLILGVDPFTSAHSLFQPLDCVSEVVCCCELDLEAGEFLEEVDGTVLILDEGAELLKSSPLNELDNEFTDVCKLGWACGICCG